MSHYKPYPAYRDSGVEWIGRVPEHWEVKRLEYVVTTHRESVASHDLASLEVLHYSIPAVQETGGGVIEDGATIDSNKLVVRCPQVLISKLNPRKNTVVIADADPDRLTVASTEFVPLLPQSGRSTLGFIASLATSVHLRQLLESRVESVTRSHQRVLPEDITKAILAIPPIDEQTHITAQLERETTLIDSLIAKKTRFIELLKEKRQALITHAVTKGRDPNVRLKDSGVEWIGEVPEHWQIVQLRRVIQSIEQGWSPECSPWMADSEEWGVLKAGCVNNGVYRESENKSLPHGLQARPDLEVRCGDILMSRANGTPEFVGSVALVSRTRPKLMLSDKIFRIGLRTAVVNSHFFVSAVGSHPVRVQIENELSGGNGLANNLPQAALLAFLVPLPPVDEQTMISNYIATESAKLDLLATRTQRSIDLLKERRAAFITAAVTGQIDLRESA